MSDPADHQRVLTELRRAEDARAQAHAREAARHRGVCWSAMGPGPYRPPAPERLEAEAALRLAALDAWRKGGPGRLCAALAEAQRAVEAARGAVSRGLDREAERCRRALAELETAARLAREVMDDRPASALSGGACATNTASSSPSTGSPRNSAS
ncbi:hypothetical protein [Phenylobacterium sp.]|uniref:hypothetical protein n=1 Tax=Phenylobacterium sp. TaxID=1871053 RepID=UPI002B7D6224|nr:hypothetical protein [Phenylobacterium sp.]HVI33828.1 hypothetical protein [Phenylobacterium sp.]